ncbi:MAG TPA: hypothetical protein VK737_03110 [Opitutales bacterium]|jgi:hypothetical protein|nr:hypothetical protein [Opitutales bacterium]
MAEPIPPVEPNPSTGAGAGGDAGGNSGGGVFRHMGWPLAVMFAAGCGLMAVVVQQCSPGAQAEKLAMAGGSVVKGMEKLAEAITAHQVTTTFTEHLVSLQPDMKNRMLVAEGRTTEDFSAQDASWLGTSTAEVRVPVTYHYYVALTDPWELNVQITSAGVVGEVIAPAMRPLSPSVDTAQLETKNSMNGSDLKDNLLKDLTVKLNSRAEAQVGLYFPIARESIEKFVRSWMLQQYNLAPTTPVYLKVIFKNEPNAPGPLVPVTTKG